MHKTHLILASTLPLILLVGTATSRSRGILPSGSLTLTRFSQSSCGSCHNPVIGGPTVLVSPGTRLLAPGASTTVTVSATGGARGSAGGFAADVTAGTLVAGSNSQVSLGGNAITHINDRSRSWTFGYKAPQQPGPVELYAVVNTVNGNGKTSGDQHAFHGYRSNATVSTPVRMFVNAKGVSSIGRGCADGYGNTAVLGAPEVPRVGNTRFKLQAIGLPPQARVMFILGLQKNYRSFDMAGMGAPGCFLHSDIAIQAFLASSAGNAERAEGRFTLPLPIPNNSVLKGSFLRAQVGAVDGSPKARAFPVVFTNGLGITIQ